MVASTIVYLRSTRTCDSCDGTRRPRSLIKPAVSRKCLLSRRPTAPVYQSTGLGGESRGARGGCCWRSICSLHSAGVFNDVFQFVTSECNILPDVTIYSICTAASEKPYSTTEVILKQASVSVVSLEWRLIQ